MRFKKILTLVAVSIFFILATTKECDAAAPALKQVVNGTFIHPYIMGSVVAIDASGSEQWAAASMIVNTATDKREAVLFMKRQLSTNKWKAHQIVQSPYTGLTGFGTTIKMYNGLAFVGAPSSVVGANTGSIELYRLNMASTTSPLLEGDNIGAWSKIQTLSSNTELGLGKTLALSQNGWLLAGNANTASLSLWVYYPPTSSWLMIQNNFASSDNTMIHGIDISKDALTIIMSGDVAVLRWTRAAATLTTPFVTTSFAKIYLSGFISSTYYGSGAPAIITGPSQVAHSLTVSPQTVYLNSATTTQTATNKSSLFFSTVLGNTLRTAPNYYEMYAISSVDTLVKYSRTNINQVFVANGTFAVDTLVDATNAFADTASTVFPHAQRVDASQKWVVVGAPSTTVIGGYVSFYSDAIFTCMF